MHKHLALQSTYDTFEIGFFINNDFCDSIADDKRHTSSLLIPYLEQLLKRNTVTFNDISFLTVNCGPAPFSSLRSIIASVNGLHCATQIPLISIDGLQATFLEFYDSTYEYNVVLLNAFNNEVYYLIAHKDIILKTGYKDVVFLLNELNQDFNAESIHFFGNGIALYKDHIENIFGSHVDINQELPQICSLRFLGHVGLGAFKRNAFQGGYLQPLHLKKHPVERI